MTIYIIHVIYIKYIYTELGSNLTLRKLAENQNQNPKRTTPQYH